MGIREDAARALRARRDADHVTENRRKAEAERQRKEREAEWERELRGQAVSWGRRLGIADQMTSFEHKGGRSLTFEIDGVQFICRKYPDTYEYPLDKAVWLVRVVGNDRVIDSLADLGLAIEELPKIERERKAEALRAARTPDPWGYT